MRSRFVGHDLRFEFGCAVDVSSHRLALHMSQTQFGLWSALAIHDTSSVVGAAAKYERRRSR